MNQPKKKNWKNSPHGIRSILRCQLLLHPTGDECYDEMFMKLLVDVDLRIYRHAFLSVVGKQIGFESVLAAVYTRVVLKINVNLFANS